MTIQAEYLADPGSKSLYKELWLAVYEDALINLKSLRVTQDITTFAEDVAIEIMTRYEKGWKAKSVFSAVIYQACRKRLYDPRYADKVSVEYQPDIDTRSPVSVPTFETQAELEGIRDKSSFFDPIIKRALIAPTYYSFLKYITQRRSLDWIRQYLEDIRRVWAIQRGE